MPGCNRDRLPMVRCLVLAELTEVGAERRALRPPATPRECLARFRDTLRQVVGVRRLRSPMLVNERPVLVLQPVSHA